MTKTMDEAAQILRGIIVDILVQRNEPSDLCLSGEEIAKAADLASQDENMVRLVALGGLGSMLYEALDDWLKLYEKTRQRWLTTTRAGRRTLQAKAPHVLQRIKAERGGVRRQLN